MIKAQKATLFAVSFVFIYRFEHDVVLNFILIAWQFKVLSKDKRIGFFSLVSFVFFLTPLNMVSLVNFSPIHFTVTQGLFYINLY